LTGNDPRDPVTVARPRDRSRLRWGMTAVLAVLAVLALVVVVLEVTTLRPRSDRDQAAQRAQSQVVSAAERFTVQYNTYDADKLPAYEKSMKPMLSPKFRTSFEKAMQQLSSAIVKGKINSKGEVLASAVASQDSDSAQVLVVADASAQTVYEKNVARHFRWQVSLVKINGSWLVDNYSAVT
jgi:Mce-associated membrane protein